MCDTYTLNKLAIIANCIKHFPFSESLRMSLLASLPFPLCYTHSPAIGMWGIFIPSCLYNPWQLWSSGTELFAVFQWRREKSGSFVMNIYFGDQNVFLLGHVWIFMCLYMMCLPGGLRIVRLLNQKMSLFFLVIHLSRWQMTIFTACFSITCRNIY